MLAIKLDITYLEEAEVAVAAGVTKFGRIDVLMNNAGNFYAGFEFRPGEQPIKKPARYDAR